MPTNYVLIDYENVQPSNLALLHDQKFKVIVFCGLSQNKISFELASGMQKLGERGKYIKTSGNGKNSLDFHIAFYVGRLSIEDPKACLHIISKDKGFDPLIAHLKSHGIKMYRVNDIAEIRILRMKNTSKDEDKILAIVQNLIGRGQSGPRKRSTLKNTINSLFAERLEDGKLTEIIEALQMRKYLVVNGDNVSYKLPSGA